MSTANDILKRIDITSGVDVNYRETTTWYDGTTMTDAKADGVIYKKKGTKYYKKTIDPKTLLKINTIADLRNTNGYYEGQEISLLGYYITGDKEPINYKFTVANFGTLVDDGGSIIKSSKGSWIAQIDTKVLAADFGLLETMPDLLTAKIRIQTCFDYAKNKLAKEVWLSKGLYEISGGGVIYQVVNSKLYFNGCKLKLANAGASGESQLIVYSCPDSEVHDQWLDGNRANNTMSTSYGTQCNFGIYSTKNITFYNPQSYNSLQSHFHSATENVIIFDGHFENAGEHGAYFNINPGVPIQRCRVYRSKFINIGLGHRGVCLSLRDYRDAYFEDCLFDTGEGIKPDSENAIIQTMINYRSSLGVDEKLRHRFNRCKFIARAGFIGGGITFSLRDYDPTANLQKLLSDGNGIYVENSEIYHHSHTNVQEIKNSVIDTTTINTSIGNNALKYENVTFVGLLDFRPLYNMFLSNCKIDSLNNPLLSIAGFVNYNQSTSIKTGKHIFKNNKFLNFNNFSNGLIRANASDTSGLELIVDGNEVIDSTNTTLVNIGLNDKTTIINNKSINSTGTSIKTLGTNSFINESNNFIKTFGTSTERPISTSINKGYVYFNSELNVNEYWNGVSWESREGNTILEIDDITKYVSQYSATNVRGSGYIYFGGNVNPTKLNNTTGISIDSTGVTLSSTRGVIVSIDTLLSKTFKIDTVTNSVGTTRIGIRCYDLQGVLIESIPTPPVTTLNNSNFFWSENFKMWIFALTNSYSFKVNDNVSKIDIIITTNTGTLRLDSFKITSYNGKAKSLDKYSENLLAIALPTNVAKEGTFYYNSNIALKVHGWIYIGSAWVEVPKFNQSVAVANVASPVPTIDSESTATEIAALVVDFNDLVAKFNVSVTLINELKTQVNAKFLSDKNSGQQAP